MQNDEIKQIREYIACPQFGDNHYGKWGALRLEQRIKIKQLLDYITNLQEKVEQYENPDDLTLFYMWLDEKAKDKMKKLQEENNSLKQMSKDTYDTSQEIMAELSQENEDYKSIIEKVRKDIQHELSHLKANDEVSWNEEFYINNKLDYRKLCIALLEQVVNKLKEKE